MYSLKRNAYNPVSLKINQKNGYEFSFIACLILYELFSIIDILVRGIDALQWEVLWFGYDFIADFTNVIGYSSGGDPYNNTIVFGLHEKGYPPLQYVFSDLVSNNTDDMEYYNRIRNYTSMYCDSRIMMLYIICTIITLILLYECLRRFKNGPGYIKTLTAFAIIFSFPIIFTVERGNSILIVLVFILVYLSFYDSKNPVLREISFIALALAAALKMTPAILGVLLIMQKRWKEALRTIIYGVLFFMLPFLFLKGGFANLPLFLRNLSLQLEAYKADTGCTINGFIIRCFGFYSEATSYVCSLFTLIICVIFLVAAFFTNRKVDKLLYLSLIMIILPSHSATYCIVYLIPALISILNESDKRSLDKFFIVGGCLCLCEFGGIIGFILLNYHNGLLIILLCAIVRSIDTITAFVEHKTNGDEIKLSY